MVWWMRLTLRYCNFLKTTVHCHNLIYAKIKDNIDGSNSSYTSPVWKFVEKETNKMIRKRSVNFATLFIIALRVLLVT
jgi:hypothetical protein